MQRVQRESPGQLTMCTLLLALLVVIIFLYKKKVSRWPGPYGVHGTSLHINVVFYGRCAPILDSNSLAYTDPKLWTTL